MLTSSYAEIYEEISKKNLLKSVPTPPLSVVKVPATVDLKALLPNQNAKRDTDTIRRGDKEKGEGGTQEKITQFVSRFAAQFTDTPSELCDTYKTCTLGVLRPDQVVYVRAQPRNPFYIVAIGEHKPPEEQDRFSNEAVGQLYKYAVTALEYQPHRKFIFAYLIDGINIQLFKVEREQDNRFVMNGSPIQSLAGGGLDILYSLVAQPPAALGLLCSFNFTIDNAPLSFHVERCIGHGGSAVVYEVFMFTFATVVDDVRSISNLYF